MHYTDNLKAKQRRKKQKMKKNNRKGFTLAELLIVVAIIGVLVAISIPIFTAQLEKAREATDLANLRSAYAEVMAAGLTEDTANYQKTVAATQTQADWQSSFEEVGGIKKADVPCTTKGNSWTVTFNPSTSAVTFAVAGS